MFQNKKTPASILDEHLADQKEIPNYIFSETLDPSSSKTLQKCSLTLFDGLLSATGEGLTKKEAKQKTAESMLVKLSNLKTAMKKLKESNEISEDIDSVKEGSSNQETGVSAYTRVDDNVSYLLSIH